MTLEEAVDFCKNHPDIAATIILEIEKLKKDLQKVSEIIQKQGNEIKRLNDIISKDSNNSSKPPSTDNKFKKQLSSKRSNIKRKRGGQKGHSTR